MQVEVSEEGLGKHFDKLSDGLQRTIKECVPPKKPFKFDGRKASTRTKTFYDQHIRDFNAGRKIRSKDRKTWNRVLNVARNSADCGAIESAYTWNNRSSSACSFMAISTPHSWRRTYNFLCHDLFATRRRIYTY